MDVSRESLQEELIEEVTPTLNEGGSTLLTWVLD